MTTEKLPEVESSKDIANTPAIHSSAEEMIKDASIGAESKNGRRLKFIPETKQAKLSLIVVGFVGVVLLLIIILALSSGGNRKKQSAENSTPVEIKDLERDNNSEGYNQSSPGNFGAYRLDLNSTQPALIKSASFEAKVGEQVSWDDGFAILVASIDRDYRPASEFDYKKVTEAGDELVRVNFLIGNASSSNIAIGYQDLALYATSAEIGSRSWERISEDIYSPRDGQILGSKQTQKISLHYRVKRHQQFSISKTKTFTQSKAKPKEGEEKNPVLTLKINL